MYNITINDLSYALFASKADAIDARARSERAVHDTALDSEFWESTAMEHESRAARFQAEMDAMAITIRDARR